MLSNILDLLLRKHFQGKIMQNIVSAPVGWCDGAGYDFQCRGVLLIWIIVRHGPAALAVCASEGCLEIFLLVYHFSLSSLSLGDGRYRLRYCLKGPFNPKHEYEINMFKPTQNTNQPTPHPTFTLSLNTVYVIAVLKMLTKFICYHIIILNYCESNT